MPEGGVPGPGHAEVLRGPPGGDDQPIVADALAGGRDERPRGRIAADDVGEAELRGREPAQDAPRRIRDLLRLETGGRHLVEQRQKAVIIAAVDPQDPDACFRQPPDGVQAGKAGADDDDARPVRLLHAMRLAPR